MPNIEWDRMEYRLKNGARVERIREYVDYSEFEEFGEKEFYDFDDYC